MRHATFDKEHSTACAVPSNSGFGISRATASFSTRLLLDRSFHVTLRKDMPAWFRWIVLVTGHLGHLARGAVFMFVAVLFFRTVGGEVGEGRTTVGDALEQLRGHPAGETVLFLLGTSCEFAIHFLCHVLKCQLLQLCESHGDSALYGFLA